MKVPDSALTARAGVDLVKVLLTTRFGFLCREQFEIDTGIDLQTESVVNGEATGRLLAWQVKTGASYLTEVNDDGYIFRPDSRHVRYWLAYNLPVLVVLVDVERGRAWWQEVCREALISTGTHWKMTIPFTNELRTTWDERFEEIADADSYILRLRQFQLMQTWMRVLADGGALFLDVEEWINKSSGRAELKLAGFTPDGAEIDARHWPYLILPWADYSVELPRLFPWADLAVDEDFYHDYDVAEWTLECGIWDSEDQMYFYGEGFEEWQAARTLPRLRPYENDGEVASWRLELTLSEAGRAFLTLDGHLRQGLMPLS